LSLAKHALIMGWVCEALYQHKHTLFFLLFTTQANAACVRNRVTPMKLK